MIEQPQDVLEHVPKIESLMVLEFVHVHQVTKQMLQQQNVPNVIIGVEIALMLQ